MMHKEQRIAPGKVTFIQLRNRCHFDIIALAQQARVHHDIVYRMLLNEPVPRASAVKVLSAYSEHSCRIYTLDTVDVRLVNA